MGKEAIVEWHTPGAPPSARGFVSLATLRERVASEATLPLAVLIFHCGRCGSTLLGRMLEVERGNRVLYEPGALQSFLELNRTALDRPEVQRDLQTLVAAYGLSPAPEERRLVIKLTSLAIRYAELFRACFPAAARVYLLRDPVEVVASELRGPASFLRLERREDLAADFGGLTRPVAEYSDAEWYAWYADRNLRQAQQHAGAFAQVIDYAEHRTAYLAFANAWSTPARLAADPGIASVLATDAKHRGVVYSAGDEGRKVPPRLRAVVEPIAGDAYAWWRARLGLR